MEKHFNTEGPVNFPDDMYRIDPLKRWNLKQILTLIQQKKYFILHAPRQTGKTSCLLALQEYLNAEGEYFALYLNVESGNTTRHDVDSATRAVIGAINSRLLSHNIDPEIQDNLSNFCHSEAPEFRLIRALMYLCSAIQKPIVLFFDEIDNLIGDGLVTILRQLRGGYDMRPHGYPSTIILCGLRDIKDYRIHTSDNEVITGGSCFNIKAESLRLGDFTRDDVIELYAQHTAETGQCFADGCIDLVMEYTEGQPWLVNALAKEVTERMEENTDRSIVITPEMFRVAKERLILSRQTHIDMLADKLKEDRVRNIMLPMILGDNVLFDNEDEDYCIDLGLIKRTSEGLKISNKIYNEVIPRELTRQQQKYFITQYQPVWKAKNGSLNVNTLLMLFKDFWHKNEDIWDASNKGYKEAAPQLVLQAFLQRVANCTEGNVTREFGLGRQRTDILVEWKYTRNSKLVIQNVVIEIKTITDNQSYETEKQKALEQTSQYAKKCKEKKAYILFFNRGTKPRWTIDDPVEQAVYKSVKMEIWKL